MKNNNAPTDTNWIDNLYSNYIQSYVDMITTAMDTLNKDYNDFKRDDQVNGIPHPEHMMYKLI